ncbi:hypothetical protein [Desulfonatronovibrio magnus]|uniref:hypothetical protein n=1 Tax=Desulfonatronovibrio magnus TaxID=698827 RepID=UPI0005EBE6BD|nr:hypothetical protein [Desulfonatronovibrio magnus]RQD65472.1 MAG: hypothetical protein D5R98_03275 [Desulfonatronovibrio sp. MSAO_Bac4]
MSVNKDELKTKIEGLFPEIQKYGLTFDLEQDAATQSWLAKFKKNEHELATHLEEKDIEECQAGIKCFNLGIQLGQFIRNYCEDGKDCKLGL